MEWGEHGRCQARPGECARPCLSGRLVASASRGVCRPACTSCGRDGMPETPTRYRKFILVYIRQHINERYLLVSCGPPSLGFLDVVASPLLALLPVDMDGRRWRRHVPVGRSLMRKKRCRRSRGRSKRCIFWAIAIACESSSSWPGGNSRSGSSSSSLLYRSRRSSTTSAVCARPVSSKSAARRSRSITPSIPPPGKPSRVPFVRCAMWLRRPLRARPNPHTTSATGGLTHADDRMIGAADRMMDVLDIPEGSDERRGRFRDAPREV